MSKTYKVQDIPFETEQLPIDRFAMPEIALEEDGYRIVPIQYELLQDGIEGNPTIGDYLTKEVLEKVAGYPAKTTVVIDLQVGKGKTQSCYNLIQDYTQQDDTIVLMLSPFRKLVEKDTKELQEERKLSVFSYKEFDVEGPVTPEVINEALEKKVHIMTVNCLLGNPGEGAFAQKWDKSEYLARLFAKCVKDKKKVIMFFDEIHEAIYNFAPQYVPNLFKWWQVVQTCFISSATYTAAVYPVFKYIGALTNNNFTLLSLRRHKWRQECISRLHLHILTEEYSANNLAPLSHLATILEERKYKRVNILTGHKTLAIALQKPLDPNGEPNPFHDILAPYNFNEVTGRDKESEFDNDGNNIGTVFKTGVNIKEPDSLMVIILPVIKDYAPDSIFNDGVPSIIQSLARQRNGGDIHIFMYQPTVLMEITAKKKGWVNQLRILDELPQSTDPYKPIRDRLPADFVAGMAIADYTDQFTSLHVLWKEYDKRYQMSSIEVEMLKSLEAQGKTKLGFQYPTFEQYLMDEGARLAARRYHEYGGDLSSYVLWAAMNSQFVNADLASISYHIENVVEVRFDSSDFKKSLLSHLTPEVVEQLKKANLIWTKSLITKAISQPKDSEATNQYWIDDSVLPINYLVTDTRFLRAVLEIAAENNGISIASNELKAQYLIHTMTSCILCDETTAKPIEKAYKRLYDVHVAFIHYYNTVIRKTGKGYAIHKDANANMPMNIADTVKEIAAVIRANDPYIKSKCISFLQGVENVTGETLRHKVFKELCKVFANVSTKSRTGSGIEKNEYYKIIGQLHKQLPNNPRLNGL